VAPERAPRRGRSRVDRSNEPLATWIAAGGEARRPSSFIPAPARAEAPSKVAAPPASSDRLLRPDDLETMLLPAIRTFPVRVEIEQALGRTQLFLSPPTLTIRSGDGVEWDFRYLGGADTFIEEVVIEFSPGKIFSAGTFRSRNPGSARPHRQLSGRLAEGTPAGEVTYTIRCFNMFGSELAAAVGSVIVVEG
jgi:hypothetical protein